jgi:adenylate cyclase
MIDETLPAIAKDDPEQAARVPLEGSDGDSESHARLARRVRYRLSFAMLASNGVGAVVVFALGFVLLPNPNGLHHTTRLAVINLIVFAVVLTVGGAIGYRWSSAIWWSRMAWMRAGRQPTERERDLTLRIPLTLQALNGTGWIAAAIIFGALNGPFSGELGVNIAIEIVLGGLVTCAAGYLLAERLLRPVTALALSSGVPRRPQLPGVAARSVLTWTLGTGVVLLGIALIGLGGLHEKRFTAHRLSIAMLVLSGVGIVVGLAGVVGLARSLAHPIDALRRAANRVGKGELDQFVPVDDGSEVGLLQAGFNQMLAGLRERERLRDLFGRQVGEDVARNALERGVELGGEAREAAVLFVDLQGSTALAHDRDPAEVVGLLNAFFAIVIEVVARHRGWVNKFEGDAALCIFGAPLQDSDASSHALAAARELRARLAAELDPIKAGIGVSAGRVVAGNIGAAERFEYTVIGDPVNEAARLSDLAKTSPERVLASESALSGAAPEEAEQWLAGEQVTLRGRATSTTLLAPR